MSLRCRRFLRLLKALAHSLMTPTLAQHLQCFRYCGTQRRSTRRSGADIVFRYFLSFQPAWRGEAQVELSSEDVAAESCADSPVDSAMLYSSIKWIEPQSRSPELTSDSEHGMGASAADSSDFCEICFFSASRLCSQITILHNKGEHINSDFAGVSWIFIRISQMYVSLI